MRKKLFLHKEFFIGLILSLSLLWPLTAAPYFTHHDNVQVIRLFEMDKCFKDRQFPCRWVPDLGGLYGYPLFNYYAPLPYYFGEIFYLITKSLLFSVKIMFATSFIGAFIFMYLLARRLWGELGGVLSAIFYSFAPYHATDLYVRGAMAEMWGLMLFPAIFWALLRLEKSSNIINLSLGAIFIAFLILSHNLSSLIFLPIALILFILFLFKRGNKKFLWYGLVSFILGFSLSAFYFLPMTLEKDLVHVETTTYGYFSYTEHFKGLRKLILEPGWDWGASIREVPGGEKDAKWYKIGWIHLLGWFLSLFAAYKLWNFRRKLSYMIIFSSIFISLSIFMIHPRSLFIWKMIEPLKYIQFPWRFLGLIIFFISFISGSVILIVNFKMRKLIWILFVILIAAYNFYYFRPERFINIRDEDFLTGKEWDKQIKRSIFDFLPIFAKEPPAELALERYQILTGDTKVLDFKEGTDWISFKTETKKHTIIRLSQYYFPEWQILVDGKPVQINYKDNTLGLMTIILGEGNHSIEAKLHNTLVRSISNMISIISFSVLIMLLLLQSNKIKKWFAYYKKGIS